MTYKSADMNLWREQRRKEQTSTCRSWAQQVRALSDAPPVDAGRTESLTDLVLLGFASDEGGQRSVGHKGTVHGPLAIRSALAPLAWRHHRAVYDAGDIWCEAGQLIIAQSQLAGHIAHLLDLGLRPMVLGGSRDVAWACFQGITRHIYDQHADATVGVISLGAHLGFASAASEPHAQTAFYQVARYCEEQNKDFAYFGLGIDEQMNSASQFDFAREQGAKWRTSDLCTYACLPEIRQEVAAYLTSLDYLYLSISLDLFSATIAPGVSHVSVFGLDAVTGLAIMRIILQEAQRAEVPLVLTDIAECNPLEDPAGHTAKLAAGLIYELAKF